jgi:hypothetical protein
MKTDLPQCATHKTFRRVATVWARYQKMIPPGFDRIALRRRYTAGAIACAFLSMKKPASQPAI